MCMQLHILTAGAEIVQNHNQRRCVSVVYVAHDETARDEPQRHVLMVQQLHPHRVDQLPGQQRLDTRRMQQVKLKLTHVIPMLLSLDSKLCAPSCACLTRHVHSSLQTCLQYSRGHYAQQNFPQSLCAAVPSVLHSCHVYIHQGLAWPKRGPLHCFRIVTYC